MVLSEGCEGVAQLDVFGMHVSGSVQLCYYYGIRYQYHFHYTLACHGENICCGIFLLLFNGYTQAHTFKTLGVQALINITILIMHSHYSVLRP